MSVWVREYEGKVLEVSYDNPEIQPDPEEWISVPDKLIPYVNTDYLVDEEGAVHPPSLEYLHQQLLSALAALRWSYQQQPVPLAGKRYSALPEDLSTLANTIKLGEDYEKSPINLQAIAEDDADPEYPVFQTNWKTLDGFIALNLEGLRSIARTLGMHVQALFSNESRITELVVLGETVDEKIDVYNAAIIDRPWSVFLLPEPEPVAPEGSE